MLEAAKEEIPVWPLISGECVLPLAADPALLENCIEPKSQLAENSRQGLQLRSSTLRWPSSEVKSRTALGMRGTLYDEGIRSRCTGKERDAESGNDNFAARYYGSNMGRFMSPDEPLLDQEESNPQSWNLYSYVRNNPLNSVDPDGNAHSECKDENGQEVCYIVGDKNGELINNGTLQWNAKKQEWEKPEEHTYNDEDRIEFIANRVSDLTSFHSIWEVGTNALPFAMGGYAAARITMAAPGLITLGLSNPSEETLVIGKVADLQQLRPGERTLDLPNQGSPKANWIQNSSRLRQAMNEGKPIRDASAGNPGSNTGFLRAERNLLQSHGWTLKGEYWVPPGK